MSLLCLEWTIRKAQNLLFPKAQCILTCEYEIQMPVWQEVGKQHRTGAVNSYCFQTRRVTLSALFKRQLSGSQLGSRWDKNVLSFKRFCSIGAVHQFSHLHSRGDKGLAGKFIFASRYTVLLSLHPTWDEVGICRCAHLKCAIPCEQSFIKTGIKKTKTKKGGLPPRKLLAEVQRRPPPTPTLLNPIPCHRLGKNQFKSQAQRGDTKMLQYILKLQMEWGFDELHEFTLV